MQTIDMGSLDKKSQLSVPKSRKWIIYLFAVSILAVILWVILNYYMFYPVRAEANFQNVNIIVRAKGRPTIPISGVRIKWATRSFGTVLNLPPAVVVAPAQQTFTIQTDPFGNIQNLPAIMGQINVINPPVFRIQLQNFFAALRFPNWATGQFRVRIQYGIGVVNILSLPRSANGTLNAAMPACVNQARGVFCNYIQNGASFVRFYEPDANDLQNMFHLFPTNPPPQPPAGAGPAQIINFGFAPGGCGGGGCNPAFLHAFGGNCP